MMQSHHAINVANMRTTIDISDRQHALFMSLARAQRTSLGKLLVELAERGLQTNVAEAPAKYELDPDTGLGIFRSGRPVTEDDVKALEDEDEPRGTTA